MAESHPEMLPGIRFLFAAVALSVSILIFGLGAAALLRAAHEEFSSSSSWRTAPEPPMVAQRSEPAKPVLAMLRFDPPPGARETSDPPAATTRADSAASAAPAEPEAVAETPPEAQIVAALNKQDTSTPAETAKPDATGMQPAAGETAAATIAENKTAANEEAAPAAKVEVMDAKVAEPAPAETAKVAMFGGSPVAIEEPALKEEVRDKPERSAVKARERAKARAEARAKARRKLAAQRARLARQRQATQQAAPGLFGQQTPAVQN